MSLADHHRAVLAVPGGARRTVLLRQPPPTPRQLPRLEASHHQNRIDPRPAPPPRSVSSESWDNPARHVARRALQVSIPQLLPRRSTSIATSSSASPRLDRTPRRDYPTISDDKSSEADLGAVWTLRARQEIVAARRGVQGHRGTL